MADTVWKRFRREQERTDGAEEGPRPEYEPVYRDGTAKNECWSSGGYGADKHKFAKNLQLDPLKTVDNSDNILYHEVYAGDVPRENLQSLQEETQ